MTRGLLLPLALWAGASAAQLPPQLPPLQPPPQPQPEAEPGETPPPDQQRRRRPPPLLLKGWFGDAEEISPMPPVIDDAVLGFGNYDFWYAAPHEPPAGE